MRAQIEGLDIVDAVYAARATGVNRCTCRHRHMRKGSSTPISCSRKDGGISSLLQMRIVRIMLSVRKTVPSHIRLMPPSLRPLLSSAFAVALAACGGGNGGSDDTPAPQRSAVAALGERIFSDATLSLSGRMSCATCHAPTTAHAGNDPDLVVPAGGATLVTPGFRNAPSLNYLNLTPAFFFDK